MNTQEITDYIFLKDDNLKGDLAFVFGTWDIWQESVEKAAELYKAGSVPKILVSSGANPVTGVIEGDLIARDLEKLGIPKEDILIENKSTNTLENVLFSKDVIEKSLGLENIHTIIAVVKNYHARRALMTLERHMPHSIKVHTANYVSSKYPMTRDTWHTNAEWSKIVTSEVEKIKAYLAKGDIEEIAK
jgi:uncharacterized SAM-binding protein YcdF (DUF218 family)